MTLCLDCDAPISSTRRSGRCHSCSAARLTLERPPQECVLCGREAPAEGWTLCEACRVATARKREALRSGRR